jgi:hypothetical protein
MTTVAGNLGCAFSIFTVLATILAVLADDASTGWMGALLLFIDHNSLLGGMAP